MFFSPSFFKFSSSTFSWCQFPCPHPPYPAVTFCFAVLHFFSGHRHMVRCPPGLVAWQIFFFFSGGLKLSPPRTYSFLLARFWNVPHMAKSRTPLRRMKKRLCGCSFRESVSSSSKSPLLMLSSLRPLLLDTYGLSRLEEVPVCTAGFVALRAG